MAKRRLDIFGKKRFTLIIMESLQPQSTKKERRELRRQEKAAQQQQEKKRTFRRVLLWFFIILGISGVIFGMVKFVSQTPPNGSPTPPTINSVTDSDWIKGNKESKIILIEYSDFQCPACGNYYPILAQLNRELGDSIQFVYRHFPLRQIHLNAELAARATEAAGRQNKFWEMHDILFEKQKGWAEKDDARDIFIAYAQSLNLDIEKFNNDLDSKEVKEKVESDYQSGAKAGVNATPIFFVNDKKIQNPRSYEEFKGIITQAINANP